MSCIGDWPKRRWPSPDEVDTPVAGVYDSAEQLYADVEILAESLRSTGNAHLIATEVQPWLDQIQIFGLHLARLDIRQDSGLYREVIDEILSTTNLVPEIASLDEVARRHALVETMGAKFDLDLEQVSPNTRETLELFTLLRRVVRSYSSSAPGRTCSQHDTRAQRFAHDHVVLALVGAGRWWRRA